jgi:hypothetical protein
MPPTGQLGADSIRIFSRWVSAGMPRGTCGETPPPNEPDPNATGDDDDGGADAAPPPPTSVCTSGVMEPEFPQLPRVLENMNPGMACIACHGEQGGPPERVAGTVYPSLHEPNRCDGVADLKVVIIGKDGNAHTFPTNAAGNFYGVENISPPYRAMVVRGNEMRIMQTPQMQVDCNGCHTEWGEGAPGRIMAP